MTEFRKFSAALDDAKLTLQTAAATDNSDSATARREAAEAIRRRCADGDVATLICEANPRAIYGGG